MPFPQIRIVADRNQSGKPAGEGDEGKLKVSFFGPFWAGYWVLERADDYTQSIIGAPGGRLGAHAR